MTLAIHLLGGCGKSADEIAAQDNARSARVMTAAQAELEADQKKFGQLASGELRAPSVQPAGQEPKPNDAPARQPADAKAAVSAVAASTAPAAAPRSAESVFSEVAPSVARVHVMDASNRVMVIGSGVVIDKAVVLTNCHVAMLGPKLAVTVNEAVMPATIQLADEALDLCRLSVSGLGAPVVAIGSVASLRPASACTP